MNLFALIIEDRHTDVEVRLFAKPHSAIDAGKAFVEDNEDNDLTEQERKDEGIGEGTFEGALWSYRYSTEGDMVRVMELEVDEDDQDMPDGYAPESGREGAA